MTFRRLLQPLLHGGSGVALAVLLPRAGSLVTQWLLTLAAGPAAVATFVNMTSRGAVVVSAVAAGLAPTIVHRARALARPAGRGLVSTALLVLASCAFSITFIYEMTIGVGTAGLVSATLSACSLFACVATAIWPIWQLQGSYWRSMVLLLALSPTGSSLAALAGSPIAACLSTGLAGASPALLMLRPARLKRALRYAVILMRRSVPLSVSNLSTAIVFPTALSVGAAVLGNDRVGKQALYWGCAAALSTASQAFAARAVATASLVADERARRKRALTSWARPAMALSLIAVLVYVMFSTHIPGLPYSGAAHDAMNMTMLVSGVAPLMTDPVCFYFTGAKSRRSLAIGSTLCSLGVATLLLAFPTRVIGQFGVIGPSAVIGVLRLFFIADAPTQKVALGIAATLLVGYLVPLLL